MLGTGDDGDTEARTQSLIGIAVAIGGNVLISLALNCQKLAHKRQKLKDQEEAVGEDVGRGSEPHQNADETRPLIPDDETHTLYTTPKTRMRPRLPFLASPTKRSSLSQSAIPGDDRDDIQAVVVEVPSESVALGKHSPEEEEEAQPENKTEMNYLRSKLWWMGFLLMNVGEFGNFLSYAYAPASVVAPLGTVALIANCLFAPLMLKERLRKRDIVGIVLAIFGAVTIVGTAKQSDIRLDYKGLIHAVTQKPFVIYSIVCVALIVIFIILAEGPAGRRWVFVDIGLCALFGGYTVLATKGISTLLSLHWAEIFGDWITYPVLAVLIVTGVGQIIYLNRALMKFDSKVVIPTFFVAFNLSTILGSAILYGDFKDVTIHQFTTFLYGIATTFVGVFFLTRPTEESGHGLEEPVVDPERGTQGGETPRAVVRPSLRGRPILRAQKSSASLVLSPGQYLLLAASPPREVDGESPTSLSRRSGL